MVIFLIRHGETSGNIAGRHQAESTPITMKGKEQAEAAADFLKTQKLTHLVSSTMIRALETASIIGQDIDMIPETNSLFTEVGRPARMNGFHLKSIYSLWFYARWFFALTDFEKEGGETYAMVRERLSKAREYLASHEKDATVAVVSHSVFIVFFLAHMCQAGRMNPFQALYRFMKIVTIKNGSITKLNFDPSAPPNTCAWSLVE